MKIIFLYLLIALSILLILTILTSCGDGNSSNEGASSGSVALYITDSPDEDCTQVELAMNSIQLVHAGLGTEGILVNDASAEVKFPGYDGINYLTHEIEQEG